MPGMAIERSGVVVRVLIRTVDAAKLLNGRLVSMIDSSTSAGDGTTLHLQV